MAVKYKTAPLALRDRIAKGIWAMKGVTNYAAQLKEWKQQKVVVLEDHPFHRFIAEEKEAKKKK